MTSVSIVTLGCGRNEVDSDQLAGLFHLAGDEVIADPLAADVVVVNTCTFIAPAKQESIDTVLEACQLKDDGSARAVIVVGCMAQRYPAELAESIPEADAIVGFDGYATLPEIVRDVLAGTHTGRVMGVGAPHPGSRRAPSLPLLMTPTAAAAPAEHERVASNPVAPQDSLDRIPASGPRFPIRAHDGRPWAYLKIASGCDRVCTFCAIPSFRGRFRSRPIDEILAEAHFLSGQGARELVLVSENTTSWGKDLGGRHLQSKLIEQLVEIDGIDLIRLMYLQPAELDDDLLVTMAQQPKVASYFDLSLQHVSGPVIERMARSGDQHKFGRLIAHIRELDPDAVFRSNFILGFPGETDSDVDCLVKFLTEYRLDWVGLFAYSPEDGTAAMSLDHQVAGDVAQQRVRMVSEIQEQVANDAARHFVGRELEVIVQERFDGDVVARSYREAPDTDGEIQLVAPGTYDRVTGRGQAVEVPVGRRVTGRVVDTAGVDLIAEVGPDHVTS
ncbi:MAG: 30S ribosomal protein S12 methylthiotransferase RimO [Nitriliruptoraceae bacterium]